MNMNKKKKWTAAGLSRALIFAGVLTGLAALILIGCDFFANPDYADSLNLPPELPYVRIETTPAMQPGYQSHRFVLEWRRAAGRVMPDAYTNQQVIDDALLNALNKWLDFEHLIEPMPYYDDGPTVGRSFLVFVEGGGSNIKINNNRLSLVLNRYWPERNDNGVAVTNLSTWMASTKTRRDAFKKAEAEVKAMIAAIEKSPLYIAGETNNSLTLLHRRLKDAIAYDPGAILDDPSKEYGQRGKFTYENASLGLGEQTRAKLDATLPSPDGSAFLYEYYLGHVPSKEEYTNQDGYHVFPKP